jgi:hypothetical protein
MLSVARFDPQTAKAVSGCTRLFDGKIDPGKVAAFACVSVEEEGGPAVTVGADIGTAVRTAPVMAAIWVLRVG